MHDGEMRYPIFATSLNSYRLSYWIYAATCPHKGLQSLMISNTYSSMELLKEDLVLRLEASRHSSRNMSLRGRRIWRSRSRRRTLKSCGVFFFIFLHFLSLYTCIDGCMRGPFKIAGLFEVTIEHKPPTQNFDRWNPWDRSSPFSGV